MTVGSDAHRLDQLSWGLEDGYAIAADAGFSELTFRRGRGRTTDRRADPGRQDSLVKPLDFVRGARVRCIQDDGET